ncbi:hypothetical protein [Streptomyces sp. NPDC127038]|uniref:hypothetical protein n=1 Tax=Streptomyces sp. NPDC127038 TaxID=3347114 RepID=UPI00365490C3
MAEPTPVAHRAWDDEWTTVRCGACGRETQWPHPELGCTCGTTLRLPLRLPPPRAAAPEHAPERTTDGAPGRGPRGERERSPGDGRPPGPGDGAERGPDSGCEQGPEGRPEQGRDDGAESGSEGRAEHGPEERLEQGPEGRAEHGPERRPEQGSEKRAEQGPGRRGEQGPGGRAEPGSDGRPEQGPDGRGQEGLGRGGGPEARGAGPWAGGTGRRPAFRPVTIRTARDAVTAAALYLGWLGYRDIRRADQRPTSGIGLAARGILAQVDPTVRPASLRDVECLWLTAMTESSECAFFSLAGYAEDARARADTLGVPLFVLDLTGTPQPVNTPATALITAPD